MDTPSFLIDLPVIDSHFHIWDTNVLDYPWLAPGSRQPVLGDHRQLMESHGFDRYRTEVGGLFPIDAGVHVEAAAADGIKESEWLTGAFPDSFSYRHIAGLPLFDATESVEQRLAQDHVVGLRHRLNNDPRINPDAIRLDDPALLHHLAELERLDGVFSLSVFPAQQRGILEMLQRFPHLRIAIDHLGWPRIENAQDSVEDWRLLLCGLARRPHSLLKLSMLWPISRTYSVDKIRPFILEALEIFGTHRVSWGSNWPVETVIGPIVQQCETILECLAELDPEELAGIMGKNAASFFDLPYHDRLTSN